jgi:2-dehydropantoate 2-reductase
LICWDIKKNESVLDAGCGSGSLTKMIREKTKSFPFEARTSYQRDIESKKGKNEGELFGGTIIRLGERLGVPTPRTIELYKMVNEK